MGVFLGDFALSVTCTTWDKTVSAIFDREYVEFEDVAGEMPFFLLQTSDIPSTRGAGDLFTFSDPVSGNSVTYKLVDVQYAEPGLSRVILAAT
jgi:hypothetical protein